MKPHAWRSTPGKSNGIFSALFLRAGPVLLLVATLERSASGQPSACEEGQITEQLSVQAATLVPADINAAAGELALQTICVVRLAGAGHGVSEKEAAIPSVIRGKSTVPPPVRELHSFYLGQGGQGLPAAELDGIEKTVRSQAAPIRLKPPNLPGCKWRVLTGTVGATDLLFELSPVFEIPFGPASERKGLAIRMSGPEGVGWLWLPITVAKDGRVSLACVRELEVAPDAAQTSSTRIDRSSPSLTLTVLDPFGDPLPAASVTIRRSDGGGTGSAPLTAITNPKGEAVFGEVPAGSYEIAVEMAGFITAHPGPKALRPRGDETATVKLELYKSR